MSTGKPAKSRAKVSSNSKTKAELESTIAELRAELDRLSNPNPIDRLVLGRCDECAMIVDDEGIVKYVSPNVGRVFCGKSTETVEGQSVAKILGDWSIDAIPAKGDEPNVFTREMEDAQGNQLVLNIVFEVFKSEIGSTLIRSHRIGNYDMKHVAEVQRQRYERMVEGLSRKYFFIGTDKDSRVTYISPSVRDVLGYEPDFVIGHDWREFMDMNLEMNGKAEEFERRRFAGIENPCQQFLVNHADGSQRLIEILEVSVIGKDGQILEAESICQDITDLQSSQGSDRSGQEFAVAEQSNELHHAKQLYTSMVDLQTQFIVRWLPNGVRTFVNQAYCEYARKSARELLGQPIFRMQDAAASSAMTRDLQRLTPANPSFIRQISFLDEFGNEVAQQWTDHGLFDLNGNLIEVQSVGRDITAMRRRLVQDAESAAFRQLLDSLSPRERQVMDLVTTGKANKVIASTLQLSVKTVEKHRSSMMRKLQVQSVAQLVRSVLRVEGDRA